eukprot:2412739-Rhodomonas_salina.2
MRKETRRAEKGSTGSKSSRFDRRLGNGLRRRRSQAGSEATVASRAPTWTRNSIRGPGPGPGQPEVQVELSAHCQAVP